MGEYYGEYVQSPEIFEWLIWLSCMKCDPSIRSVQRPHSTLRNTSLGN